MDIWIDLETYSDVDLGKAGLYRYTASPAFSILLFAYSFNGEPVQVIDLAQGEEIPIDIRKFLFNANVVKHAYNASFEWQCLSRHFGLTPQQAAAWLPQWRDTQLQALYCGLPTSLRPSARRWVWERTRRSSRRVQP